MTHGPARMQVRVQDWPDGRPGIRLSINDQFYQFTVDAAVRLRDALNNHIEQVKEPDEAEIAARSTDE